MLWDEKYAGKVALINSAEDSWWCAAVYAGVDYSQLNEEGLVVVSDADIARVRELLTQQRNLVRMYSSDMTSLQQALASGELVAAVTRNETAWNLRSEGVPVKFADPKEGALTWCCSAVVHKDAPNVELAHEMIDSMNSTETGKFIIGDFGYGHSNLQSFEAFPPQELVDRGLSANAMETLARGHFIGGIDTDVQTRINRDWEEITAGF